MSNFHDRHWHANALARAELDAFSKVKLQVHNEMAAEASAQAHRTRDGSDPATAHATFKERVQAAWQAHKDNCGGCAAVNRIVEVMSPTRLIEGIKAFYADKE
jgi:hypothetical protein